jgi:hypothetical protein
MDTLTRCFREKLTEGWCEAKGGPKEYKTASVYSSWSSYLTVHGDMAALDKTLWKTWRALEAIGPPMGWLPESPNDPLIQEAFGRGWPLAEPNGAR